MAARWVSQTSGDLWVNITNHDPPVDEGLYRDLTDEILADSGVTAVR